MSNHENGASANRLHGFYTYAVSVSFQLQFTLSQNDVEQAEEGGENEVDPTEKALADWEKELFEYLLGNYGVVKLEVCADQDQHRRERAVH